MIEEFAIPKGASAPPPAPGPNPPDHRRRQSPVFIGLVLTLLAAMLMTANPAAAQSQNISEIRIYGSCLTVTNYDFELALWAQPCRGSANQKFKLHGGGQITLAYNTHTCLDVTPPWSGTAVSAGVHRCNGSSSQKFSVSLGGEIVSRHDNRCLSVTNPWRPQSTTVDFARCSGQGRQRFAFPQLPTIQQRCASGSLKFVRVSPTSQGFRITTQTRSAFGTASNPWGAVSQSCTPWFYRGGIWSYRMTPAVQSMRNQVTCNSSPFALGLLGGVKHSESWHQLGWNKATWSGCGNGQLPRR